MVFNQITKAVRKVLNPEKIKVYKYLPIITFRKRYSKLKDIAILQILNTKYDNKFKA